MSYRLVEIDLAAPASSLALSATENGLAIVARWNGRLIGFKMIALGPGQALAETEIAAICSRDFAKPLLAAKSEPFQEAAGNLPTLTIAICTKDRAERLSRLLTSLMRHKATSPFPHTEILVVDNASIDDGTRRAAERFAGIRYIFEGKAGLNFARNAAVSSASGSLLAFLDDDVVIDRGWFEGLAKVVRSQPSAGGCTGLVLPYRLDTEAQIAFEARGGFGRGFERRAFHATSFENPLHPSGVGGLGAGCNMAFNRDLLITLGGFDEALDTGRPLPGGGDLDMFYRVLRAGHPMVYEPAYAVYHEHRETIDQLRHQYWTWGLGLMAFLVKSRRTDPANEPQLRKLYRWWLLDQLQRVATRAARRRWRDCAFQIAEFMGGLQGRFGEYDRSKRRIAAIRAAQR